MEPRLDAHSVRKCEMSHAWPAGRVAKCLLMVVLLGLCKCYEEFGLDLLHLKSALR